MTTNITEDDHRAFEALTSGEAGSFCLFSCYCSGRPAPAIAAVPFCPPTEEGGEPEYVISPEFSRKLLGERTECRFDCRFRRR